MGIPAKECMRSACLDLTWRNQLLLHNTSVGHLPDSTWLNFFVWKPTLLFVGWKLMICGRFTILEPHLEHNLQLRVNGSQADNLVWLPAGAIPHSEHPKIILPRCKRAAMVAPHEVVASWQDDCWISCFQQPEHRYIGLNFRLEIPPFAVAAPMCLAQQNVVTTPLALLILHFTKQSWEFQWHLSATFNNTDVICAGTKHFHWPTGSQVLACWWRCTGERSDPPCRLFPRWFYPGTALDAEKRLAPGWPRVMGSLNRLCTMTTPWFRTYVAMTFEGPGSIISIYHVLVHRLLSRSLPLPSPCFVPSYLLHGPKIQIWSL